MNKLMKTFSILVTTLFLSTSYVFAENKNLSVEYVGEAKKLLTTEDDFFINISDALPGDILNDYAKLKNDSNKEVQLFFKTEPLSKTEYTLDEDYELLEKIHLSINLDKGTGEIKTIYDGKLGSKDFTEWKSLGNYSAGEEGQLNFMISVPAELTNEFNMTNTKVKWVFGIGEKESGGPNTGDNQSFIPYILGIGLSSGIFILLISKSKKKNKERS